MFAVLRHVESQELLAIEGSTGNPKRTRDPQKAQLFRIMLAPEHRYFVLDDGRVCQTTQDVLCAVTPSVPAGLPGQWEFAIVDVALK